ncbi:MAG: glycosyltransferase family 4 protein [Acidimicrobiales bacterium]
MNRTKNNPKNPTILLNALATRLGGGATVWAALLAGGRAFADDLNIVAITADRQVDSLLRDANPEVQVHRVEPKAGIASFAGEAKLIDEELGADPGRIVISQNRMTRGHSGRQIVLHVNLSRFQQGTGARGWKQRPAEVVRNTMAKAALTGADANIFESTYVFDAATARYPEVSINNPSVALVGIEAQWAVDADATVNPLSARGKRLLALTSPQPHKDNNVLVHTIAELERTEPGGWKLAIAGGRTPEVWAPQVELAQSLGVTDSIEWLGFLDRSQLMAEFDRTTALISPSRVESFAMGALESMARGVPAIVTGEASMPESVGGAGIMVDAGRADLFAKAARELVASEAEWANRSRIGRQWAATMTWDDFGREVMQVVRGQIGAR